MSGDLVARTITLCRALRDRGVLATSGHAIDAVRALTVVNLDSRERVRLALRCVLTARPEEFEIFDQLFDELFETPRKNELPESKSTVRKRAPPQAQAGAASLSQFGGENEIEADDQPEEVPGASDQKTSSEKDFSTFSSAELEEIGRVARKLARRLAARPSRRWKSSRRGPRVDLRATVRRSLATGDVVELRRRKRRPRKTRIVAICDVSGSMDLYSQFLLQFLFALQGTLARVESFVFATGLKRVSDILQQPDYRGALRGLSAEVEDFSGGTRIGECLATFNRDYARFVDRRTVVVILSDGWDTGEPAVLSEAMESLRFRSRKVIWLNPLLGSPGYEPLTQGMQAALPHVSVFAPVHNLAALRALERHLLS
ncbi:MAG TPA: VWA domain-containing protein [Myxococcales bacterium]|nr:VWA domain-containing protein [Myxococcales bacterium]